MLATIQKNSNNLIIGTDSLKVESPRDVYSFINRLINDRDFYLNFQTTPLNVLEEYNFDTSNIIIPDKFILPSQRDLKERLVYINNYEDFVSPSQIQSLPVLPAIFVFIPIFTY